MAVSLSERGNFTCMLSRCAHAMIQQVGGQGKGFGRLMRWAGQIVKSTMLGEDAGLRSVISQSPIGALMEQVAPSATAMYLACASINLATSSMDSARKGTPANQSKGGYEANQGVSREGSGEGRGQRINEMSKQGKSRGKQSEGGWAR